MNKQNYFEMIIPGGYSKDPNLIPEAIVLTLPVQFFEKRNMTIPDFKKYFERFMQRETSTWSFRLTNLPTFQNIAWCYLIFDKHLQYELNFVQFERNVAKKFKDSPGAGVLQFPPSNWVIMTGPLRKPPQPYELRGFQGFRKAIKLF